MEHRIRELHARVVSLCQPAVACNVRLGAAEARLNYVRVRVEGADAMDVGRLAARFPDCRFHLCSSPGGCAIDVYIPTRRPVAVTLLHACSAAAAVAAAAAMVAALY